MLCPDCARPLYMGDRSKKRERLGFCETPECAVVFMDWTGMVVRDGDQIVVSSPANTQDTQLSKPD